MYPPPHIQKLFASSIPIISCSTGNVGNNGALTAITALATTYSAGAWVLYPTHAISASIPAAPAFYWTVFSSPTAGTIYNNVMPASGFPTPPIANTPFVTTGPGAFVGNTAATVLATIPLPAGQLGPNGKLWVKAECSFTNSGGTKTITVNLGATSFLAPAALTTNTNTEIEGLISNVSSLSVNKGSVDVHGGTTVAAVYGSINTAVAQNITFNNTNNTATDNFVLEDLLILLIPG